MERMTALEFKKWLEVRTREFATATFKYLDALPKKNSTRVIVYQLGKSASSVGANYREANRGESGDDFRHKISIALKEANESLYWLEILVDLYPTHETPVKLRNEAEELLKLLQSISRSSRQRTKSNNPNNQNNRTILHMAKG